MEKCALWQKNTLFLPFITQYLLDFVESYLLHFSSFIFYVEFKSLFRFKLS